MKTTPTSVILSNLPSISIYLHNTARTTKPSGKRNNKNSNSLQTLQTTKTRLPSRKTIQQKQKIKKERKGSPRLESPPCGDVHPLGAHIQGSNPKILLWQDGLKSVDVGLRWSD